MNNYVVPNPNIKYVESNLSSNIMVGEDGSYYYKEIKNSIQSGLKYGTKTYNSKGYPIMAEICIKTTNGRAVINVGRLVLEAFGQPKPFKEARVMHLNNDAFDNHLSNLKWATVKESMDNRNQPSLTAAQQKSAKEHGYATWNEMLQDNRYKHMRKLGFDNYSDYVKYLISQKKKLEK